MGRPLDVRNNPSLLKLDLYCKGARLDDSCLVEEQGGRKILRTRAGLGSGLECILPGGYWTNVPVQESFAAKSPYLLRHANDRFLLEHDVLGHVAEIALSPRPDWYTRKTATGKPMTRIGSLQGTYLGVYPSKVCEYWLEKPKEQCRFCSVGLNLGADDADEKSVNEVSRSSRRPGANRGSPTSTSTPATTKGTPTSTSSSRTSRR